MVIGGIAIARGASQHARLQFACWIACYDPPRLGVAVDGRARPDNGTPADRDTASARTQASAPIKLGFG
jgi:hypothetical protein